MINRCDDFRQCLLASPGKFLAFQRFSTTRPPYQVISNVSVYKKTSSANVEKTTGFQQWIYRSRPHESLNVIYLSQNDVSKRYFVGNCDECELIMNNNRKIKWKACNENGIRFDPNRCWLPLRNIRYIAVAMANRSYYYEAESGKTLSPPATLGMKNGLFIPGNVNSYHFGYKGPNETFTETFFAPGIVI